MLYVLSVSALVIFLAIFANKFLNTLGIPMLLFFLCLGLLFSSDSVFNINYTDFYQAKEISSILLGFIIFYGGFCTKWKIAKKVLLQASLLSTFGVLLTALLVGAFCLVCFNLSVLESFLIGSVIASTDAASVFSILKSKKLFLKENTAQLLELESGSNDPMSYVLVVLVITLMQGLSSGFVFWLFFKQMFFGVLTGVVIAKFAIYIFQKTRIIVDGNESLFLIALVLASYVLPYFYDGNPYLAVYFLGIILGNTNIDNKISMMNFFDGITKLAQIGIFFLLGLLAESSKLPQLFYSGCLMFMFLTFIARPFMVFALLLKFKSSLNQKFLVSWAGLRGVASIVFAIIAMDSGIKLEFDLFHLVFLVCALSVAVQGTFLPIVAKFTKMNDENVDIKKTFNDYHEECAVKFMKLTIPTKHQWIGKKIRDIKFPDGSLALLIKRGKERVLPKESTIIKEGDKITLVLPIENL